MARRRVKARFVTLVAEAKTLFVARQPGDRGTPERARQAGGITEGFRRDPDRQNQVVRGAHAAQPGQLEQLIVRENARRDAQGHERLQVSMLLHAAEDIRRCAQVARLRKRVTGGYLMAVPGRDGVDRKQEAREEQAALRLKAYGRMVGQIAFCAVLDLVVFEMNVGPHREPHALLGLGRIGDFLRRQTTSKKGN